MTSLFEPVTFGKIPLANRLVMAPMTRNRAEPRGNATELMAEYYAQRASAGLVITEGVQPSRVGQGFLDTPGLHDPEQVESWRAVTDAVHDGGGRIVAQLMHAGRIGHPSLYADAHRSVAPSPVAAAGQCFTPDGMRDYEVPHELAPDEITATVRDFAAAARNAVEAGFDGVQVHAGNGFLLHQFLAENTNRRTDAYGGPIENRVRFAVEVTEAVAAAIGNERTAVRVSPGNPYNDIAEGDTEALYAALVPALPELAFLEVCEIVTRPVTRSVRELWKGNLVVNPHPSPDSFPATGATAQEVLDEGLADAVSLGALFLANPDLPARIEAGGPFNEADEATYYGGDHRGYTDYPALAR
ncbi:alkene reductase [Streptomyces somaliensis DSM 40738]|uniref:Alkene reductase n=1 Tax=Streptomyces somaliensis (strain ATCC 33201 / DSM 40738 / JCM 12659 / KCTC 9044 / NCTC 11332 / NRRL B-12077 / IP 733) TaxID=1134445 RepID=A0AA44IF87_STRE0|nr:alkene reductase [Streptomyces somaliensis]MCQ0025020.1 alkene reductase [Streptomyces somaliensis DSM 40738]NKY16446.1 alkene reductase [Streptomyces somaliensis DSM 40738]